LNSGLHLGKAVLYHLSPTMSFLFRLDFESTKTFPEFETMSVSSLSLFVADQRGMGLSQCVHESVCLHTCTHMSVYP
jgi:hypothetical protein